MTQPLELPTKRKEGKVNDYRPQTSSETEAILADVFSINRKFFQCNAVKDKWDAGIEYIICHLQQQNNWSE